MPILIRMIISRKILSHRSSVTQKQTSLILIQHIWINNLFAAYNTINYHNKRAKNINPLLNYDYKPHFETERRRHRFCMRECISNMRESKPRFEIFFEFRFPIRIIIINCVIWIGRVNSGVVLVLKLRKNTNIVRDSEWTKMMRIGVTEWRRRRRMMKGCDVRGDHVRKNIHWLWELWLNWRERRRRKYERFNFKFRVCLLDSCCGVFCDVN
jgi:hypothetical protein